jgi:hypothetical protein
VLTEIKNRGVEDVCITVCDGLKGLPEAINTVRERAEEAGGPSAFGGDGLRAGWAQPSHSMRHAWGPCCLAIWKGSLGHKRRDRASAGLTRPGHRVSTALRLASLAISAPAAKPSTSNCEWRANRVRDMLTAVRIRGFHSP